MSRTASARIKFLIAILAGSGVLHFARPKPYLAIVPKMLRHKRELVYLSGLVELIGAAMMATPRTRRQGGALSAALLVAVFPANVSMALRSARRPPWYRAAAWARLPLQLPLVKWAWQSGNQVQPAPVQHATSGLARAAPDTRLAVGDREACDRLVRVEPAWVGQDP